MTCDYFWYFYDYFEYTFCLGSCLTLKSTAYSIYLNTSPYLFCICSLKVLSALLMAWLQVSNNSCSWRMAVHNSAITHKGCIITEAKSTMGSAKRICFKKYWPHAVPKCKKTRSDWRQGNNHALKSNRLIHCIRTHNNSPAAIIQQRHSQPRHLFLPEQMDMSALTVPHWSNLRCRVETPAEHLT